MAFFKGTIRSDVMVMDTALTVVLPFDMKKIPEKECPAVFLLHGLKQGSDAWARMSSAERYANEYGVALVMPEVQRSFYTDMEMGLRYFTYVSEELPKICSEMFHLSARRQDRFAAGLSMGGYGAVKLGLRAPHVFSACAGFSGCLDMQSLLTQAQKGGETSEMAQEVRAIFGTDLTLRPEDDLFRLAEKTALLPEQDRPRVMVTCGEQDFLLSHNRRFRDRMEPLPYEFVYREWPGAHEWSFWDQSIQYALEFFLPGRREALAKLD